MFLFLSVEVGLESVIGEGEPSVCYLTILANDLGVGLLVVGYVFD